MEELVQKLRILGRTQMTLMQIQGHRLGAQVLAYSIAVLLGLLAMALVNYAIFGALVERFGAVSAALVMAFGDLLLAAVMVQWAGRQQPGPEEALVEEIQSMVLEQIELDVAEVGRDLAKVRSVLTGEGGMGPLGAIMPLVSSAVDLLKIHKS